MLRTGRFVRIVRVAVLVLCVPTALASSYSFTGQYGLASTVSDCDGETAFRASLLGDAVAITISSSNGNSVTCADASVAPSIAAAYKAGTTSTFTCDGLECECRARSDRPTLLRQ